MAPRSRTGCLTCRHRKLKCDEQRPVCGQCVKAKRVCVPSSGITFRHQQNPSLNGEGAPNGGLNSFYGYKETFSPGAIWVNVPQKLEFIHTSNPYEDTEIELAGVTDYSTSPNLVSLEGGRYDDGGMYSGLMQAAQAAYPAYATHGLEALSAVASQDQYSYTQPPSTLGQHDVHDPPQTSQDPDSASQSGQTSALQNLDCILNPSAAELGAFVAPTGANIDPRLHAEIASTYRQLTPEANSSLSAAAPAFTTPTSLADELRLNAQS